MTEELEQLLKNLKLRRMLEIYDEQLRAADKDDISYSEFVTRLVRAQFQARQEGADQRRRTTPTLSGDKLSSPASLVVSGASGAPIYPSAGR
jgi:hypothetical protein